MRSQAVMERLIFYKKGIHKAWGIETTGCKNGKFKEQEIMAFGDSENDIEMLQLAGISMLWRMLIRE